MDFVAYHDRTSADHQSHFDQLFPQGYRMISLSVYGARHDERYAAVWVRRGGPDWSAVHGVDGAGYQAAFDRAAAAGYKPVLLSAAGPENDPVFAGTFEHTTQGIPLTRFGLRSGDENDPWTIEHWIREARRNNWHPTAIAVYGAGNDLRFAGIWEANQTSVAWTEAGIADDFATYQQRFDALAPAGGRPVQVAVSPDGRYASIFRDDQIGPWVARHGLTSAGYQQEFDRLVPQGFYPIDVHAGGQGGATRFAALFAQQESVQPLVWHAPTGPTTVAAIDTLIQQAMQRHRIRGAGVALVRDARLVYAKGYTLAEAAYPSIQPTTLFRQASVSKTIVALAVYRLIQDGRLTFATPRAGCAAPAASGWRGTTSELHSGHRPASARAHQRTAERLLWRGAPRRRGIQRRARWTAGISAGQWATDRSLHDYAASHTAAGDAHVQQLGLFPAGPRRDGRDRQCDARAGTGRTALSTARYHAHPTGAYAHRRPARRRGARYHATTLPVGPSMVVPDRRLMSSGYGGFWNFERDDAGGGLTGSVVDMARLLAMLDVRTNNPVLTPATIGSLFSNAAQQGGHGFDTAVVFNAAAGSFYGMKGGDLPESSQNGVRYQTGDFAMAICWNRSDIAEGGSDGWWYPDYPALLTIARAQPWPATDLFPGFGMPSLV